MDTKYLEPDEQEWRRPLSADSMLIQSIYLETALSRLCECRKQVEELQGSQRTFAAEQLSAIAARYRANPGMDAAYQVADDLDARAVELRAKEYGMSLREVQPGEENLPTCKVCGAMVKGSKCLSCGEEMDEKRAEWPCAMHVQFTDYCHQCKKVFTFAASEVTEATRELKADHHRRGVEIIHWTEIAGAHLCRAEAAESALAAEQSKWRCFHCDFVATTREEAEAHFGDGDEAGEFVPICKWWQNSDEDERKHAHQSLLMDLNQARGEVGRMRELEESVDNFKRLRDDDQRQIEKAFGEDCTSLWTACDRYGNLNLELAQERDRVRELTEALNSIDDLCDGGDDIVLAIREVVDAALKR